LQLNLLKRANQERDVKLIICLGIMLTFIGCGMPFGGKRDFVRVQGETTKLHSSTAPAFSSYVKQFEDQAKVEKSDANFKVGDIPINFGDTTEPHYDGVCLIYADGTKEIIIKESWWKQVNPVRRRIMVFHELGHCRLGRTHDSSTVEIDGRQVKTSIMNPEIPDHATFDLNEEGYLTELFTQSKSRLLQILGIEES